MLRSILVPVALMLTACGTKVERQNMPKINPVGYFEISVADLDRATRFYSTVFQLKLEREVVDGYEMALFPFKDGESGASGALAKGDVYVPGKSGAILYFTVEDIDGTLARAKAAGGRVLLPKKSIGSSGHVAELEDSEGNRIAVHTPI